MADFKREIELKEKEQAIAAPNLIQKVVNNYVKDVKTIRTQNKC